MALVQRFLTCDWVRAVCERRLFRGRGLSKDEMAGLLFGLFCLAGFLGFARMAVAEPLEAAAAEAPMPRTGLFPVILAVFAAGIVLLLVWLRTSRKKPKKLGGAKGDVW